MTEHEVWDTAFKKQLLRGDDAVKAAHAANNAVLVYRGGPLGVRVAGASEVAGQQEADPAIAGFWGEQPLGAMAGGAATKQAQQAEQKAKPYGGVTGAAIGNVAKQVAEFHEQAAAAKQPRFKFGDRVLVTPPSGVKPFFATVAGYADAHHCTTLVGMHGRWSLDWLQHAPEVSHDQC